MTPENRANNILSGFSWTSREGCSPLEWIAGHIREAEARARAEVMRESDDLLREIKRHCVCTRNVTGFDYGEKHPILGKPAIGKRWLVPADMIDAHFKKVEAGEVRIYRCKRHDKEACFDCQYKNDPIDTEEDSSG